MNSWKDTAIQLLSKSLKPIPIELNEIDWKTDISDNGNRIAQHISAFANYPGGGFLAFGIDNNGQSISLSKVTMDIIIQKIGNIARNNLAQPIGVDHLVTYYNEIPVLLVHIPEYQDKPVHIRGKDIYESYKRSAGQTVKLSRQEVKHLIIGSTGLEYEDIIAASQNHSDEVLKMLDYDQYFMLLDKRLPDTKQGILDSLADDGLIKKAGANWDITNLGGILFAKDLNSFKSLYRKIVRVIIYKNNSRINAIKEEGILKGYATGFEGMISYIMDQLPTNEVIEAPLRQQLKIYPDIAIREFVANAIIHQDLSITGAGVMVEIFKDRIEITNPGAPLVDTNRFIDAAPKSRNETLASLMRRLNICEERGSGVDRAIEVIEEFQLPAPKFIRGDEYTRVIIYAPLPLTKMNSEDRIRACYQHTCLHYVHNEAVNNQSIRKRFNINKNNVSFASKIIADTIDAGFIKPSDPENISKKFASYVPYWA
jgi:predicted HTH transcriptional regulator